MTHSTSLLAVCVPTGLSPILGGIAPPNLRREQLTYILECQAIQQSTPPLQFNPRPAEPPTTASEVEPPFPPSRRHPNSLWVWDQQAWENITSLPVLRWAQTLAFPVTSGSPWTSSELESHISVLLMSVGAERKTASCICGGENQTAHHIIYHCAALQPPSSLDDLASPGPEDVCWLDQLVGIARGLLLAPKKK